MKKSIPLILLFYFAQGIIHNLGHPVTPAFVRSQSIPDYFFGVFFAAMSFGMVIGSPIWGMLSDQGKKKRYILIGLTLYSIGQLGFGYAFHPGWMIVFRFISGFGVSSSITLFTTEVIQQSDPTNRAKHLAYLGATVTLGASIGYWLGGFLGTNAWIISWLGTNQLERIFLIQGISNMLYVGWIAWKFKEQSQAAITTKQRYFPSFKSLFHVDWSLFFFFLALVSMTIGSINLSKYIDVYFDELGYTPQDLGTFVMVTGIVSLLTSLFLVKWVSSWKRQMTFLSFIHVSSAVIVFIVFRSASFLLTIYTIYMLYMVLRTLHQPLEQNYIAANVSPHQYGITMGLRQSFVSIGMVIGPLIGGFLYERNPLFLFDSSAWVFLIGILFLSLSYVSKKRRSE